MTPMPSMSARRPMPPMRCRRATACTSSSCARVIGVGGFGIVYLAFDHSLEREVAIKEYMPSRAGRAQQQACRCRCCRQRMPRPSRSGLSSFVNEARLLARFDHPSLVKVHRFWEDNGTAYMVMPLYRGRTLRGAAPASATPAPTSAWLRALLEPLLGALERAAPRGRVPPRHRARQHPGRATTAARCCSTSAPRAA